MAKLTCTADQRRVMVLPNGRVIHRQDGSGCKSPDVTIKGVKYAPWLMLLRQRGGPAPYEDLDIHP